MEHGANARVRLALALVLASRRMRPLQRGQARTSMPKARRMRSGHRLHGLGRGLVMAMSAAVVVSGGSGTAVCSGVWSGRP